MSGITSQRQTAEQRRYYIWSIHVLEYLISQQQYPTWTLHALESSPISPQSKHGGQHLQEPGTNRKFTATGSLRHFTPTSCTSNNSFIASHSQVKNWEGRTIHIRPVLRKVELTALQRAGGRFGYVWSFKRSEIGGILPQSELQASYHTKQLHCGLQKKWPRTRIFFSIKLCQLLREVSPSPICTMLYPCCTTFWWLSGRASVSCVGGCGLESQIPAGSILRVLNNWGESATFTFTPRKWLAFPVFSDNDVKP